MESAPGFAEVLDANSGNDQALNDADIIDFIGKVMPPLSDQTFRIATYITAFEDHDALVQCLQCLQQQDYPIELTFIVDNSKSPLLQSSDGLIVEHHPENIGVAGGLKRAIAWAIQEKFDFLWAFDQDSTPDDPTLLRTLIALYKQEQHPSSPLGIVAPLPLDLETNQPIHGENWVRYHFEEPAGVQDDKLFYDCDVLITSGSLISIDAAKNSPPPLESLFLDAADWLYCLGLRRKGYRIVVSKTAILKHQLGNSHKVLCPVSQQTISTYTCSALRYYYSARNHTYFATRMASSRYRLHAIKSRLVALKQNLGHIGFYESAPRRKKAYAYLRGTFDGLIGRLGRTW